MASYRAGFDPPSRHEYRYQDRRTGAYIPTSSRAPGETFTERNYKEAEKGRLPSEMEKRQESQKSYTRSSSLPKPRSNTQPSAPAPVKPAAGKSSFGFRGQTAHASVADEHQLQTQRSKNVLRRKPSTISQHTSTPRNISSCTRSETSSPLPPMPLHVPESIQPPVQVSEEFGDYPEPTIPIFLDNSPSIIPELDRYRFATAAPSSLYQRDVSDVPYKLATQDLPPNPTPLNSGLSGHSQYSSGFSGYSASPSTWFSESPRPGPYSRDTTPTSMSSQSPGLIAPLRVPTRLRQASPIHTRPPVTRRRMGSASEDKEVEVLDMRGLPSLRESLTSSSSNLTKGSGKDEKKEKERKKKKRLSPLPPSPPPRKSSQKFKSNPSSTDPSPSKSSKSPARPLKNAGVTSPLTHRNVTSPQNIVTSPRSNLTSPNPSHSSIPPRRPSRDGTSDLQGLALPVNIVQSNLSGVPISADRRISGQGLGRRLGPSPQLGTSPRPGMQSRLPSRSGAPSPVQQIQREATPAPAGLGLVPDLRPDPNRMRPGLRTPSPTTTAPKHRFGLFGRRTKTAPAELPTVDKQQKSVRKGPAAGTGHEGYGRYAPRGRSNTISSRDRSHSNASSATSQDSYWSLTAMHDPFFSQRMSPVIIAGGGEVIENYNSSSELTRSESNQSLPFTQPSLKSQESLMSSRSNLSNEVNRITLWPSAMPRNATGNRSSISLASKVTLLSDSSDNDSFYPKKSLAVRRSMLRLNKNDLQGLNLPKPIKIPAASESGLSSLDTTYVSDGPKSEPTRGFLGKKTTAPKKLTKRPASPRKWNFFQRSKNSEAQLEAVAVVVTSAKKPVAYYAMIDSSEQEDEKELTIEDIEDLLRQGEVVDLSKPEIDWSEKESYTPPPISEHPISKRSPTVSPEPISERPAALPISKRLKDSEIPKMWKLEDKVEQAPIRPSRLAQVGRIPRVVTARPQQTSPKSFSRPFARISMIKEPTQPITVDAGSVAVGPSPERSPETLQSPLQLPYNASILQNQEAYERERPFLVISPRKPSETGTTSSSGAVSSYAGTTAIIPKPDDALEEDEVWDEYDDLIGQDEADKVPQSATSSHGAPFQYEGFESRSSRRSKPKESPVINSTLTMPAVDVKLRIEPTSADSRPPSLGTTIRNVLNAPSPTTPTSFTDFISGYDDRNNSAVKGSGGSRRVSPFQSQHDSRPISGHSKSASMSGVSRLSGDKNPTSVDEQVQESPLAQVNLRVGSMTVSKWLTFGHVIFSPARESLLNPQTTRHHSILVLDGLGNDDWSFYAAETYSEATFYNLSPTANRSTSNCMSMSTIALPAPPANHRQVQHLSLAAKFPFTPSTFTVVVLRFPPASSEALLRHLIAESKRVLKPGGYLELSILDLDMLNMGPKTRRAVRKLKIGISLRDPDISLASMADTLLRLTGKRGFTDVKSCTVGVPVASVVSNTSSAGASVGGQAELKKEVSLAELMRDPSAKGDEGITKIVARVGRWWFGRCYESGAGGAGADGESIFRDGKVLEEAERWGTSFKLLVAYAQKPVVPRRRTASV